MPRVTLWGPGGDPLAVEAAPEEAMVSALVETFGLLAFGSSQEEAEKHDVMHPRELARVIASVVGPEALEARYPGLKMRKVDEQ